MRESPLRITIPAAIVKTEPMVLTRTIFPASLLFAPIASAIIKLTMAVGHANKINIIPNSFPV